MAKTKQEINPKSAERLKRLYIEHNVTQIWLSNETGISQNTLSRIANGKTALSYKVACDIAKALPGVSPYWLMGESDYSSGKEEMLAKVKKSRNNAKIRYDFMQYLFESSGYRFKYLSKNKEIPGIQLEEDFYGAIEGELVTSCITIGEFRNLVSEVENYASYLVKKTVEQGMSRVVQPFRLPKEDIEGEKDG